MESPKTEIPTMRISDLIDDLRIFMDEFGDAKVVGWNSGDAPVVHYVAGVGLTIDG